MTVRALSSPTGYISMQENGLVYQTDTPRSAPRAKCERKLRKFIASCNMTTRTIWSWLWGMWIRCLCVHSDLAECLPMLKNWSVPLGATAWKSWSWPPFSFATRRLYFLARTNNHVSLDIVRGVAKELWASRTRPPWDVFCLYWVITLSQCYVGIFEVRDAITYSFPLASIVITRIEKSCSQAT